MKNYPRAFSHIGLSVPNLDAAVKFYSEVMGWYVVMEPSVVKEENDTAIGVMCTNVFGSGYESFKIAHMVTSDGIGIEFLNLNKMMVKNNRLIFPTLGCSILVFKILILKV